MYGEKYLPSVTNCIGTRMLYVSIYPRIQQTSCYLSPYTKQNHYEIISGGEYSQNIRSALQIKSSFMENKLWLE